ncbi:hypothetical protein DEO72_LG8g1935 [Vigna unguiculata]|uniref:Uncharacterized protein n=1 Tax=Vigna unguiculata TaxID=3917 RepID=A0A4D6MVH6_VIGUN|nr:hypothetical protein DEO72_LG8g1935 [Vigna unguiculata]
MSDDRFDVVVHHGGEVEAHEEAAEVEIGDASGLNSDVEVEGEIEMEGDIEVETMFESDDSSRGMNSGFCSRKQGECERISLQQELESIVWFNLCTSLKRRALFWATEYLAQARGSCLSEKS